MNWKAKPPMTETRSIWRKISDRIDRACDEGFLHTGFSGNRPDSATKKEETTMRKYRRMTEPVEAITFDELVQIGIRQGVPLNNGMPWSFNYRGFPITHENDDCYLVNTSSGTVRFDRGRMLVFDNVEGEAPTTCPADLFERVYEAVDV